MAGNKKQATNPEKQPSSENQGALSELDTLRNIVFGSAKAELEAQLAQLEQSFKTQFQNMQKSMDTHFANINEKINSVDHHHDEKSAELRAYSEKLSSELEMSDSSGRQDTDELHIRVDKEVATLTERYDAGISQALEKLEQVSKELSSSKTDRKTLAKLLATMATNLESDQE